MAPEWTKRAKISFESVVLPSGQNCHTEIMLWNEFARGNNFPDSENTSESLRNASLTSLPLDLDIPMRLQNLQPPWFVLNLPPSTLCLSKNSKHRLPLLQVPLPCEGSKVLAWATLSSCKSLLCAPSPKTCLRFFFKENFLDCVFTSLYYLELCFIIYQVCKKHIEILKSHCFSSIWTQKVALNPSHCLINAHIEQTYQMKEKKLVFWTECFVWDEVSRALGRNPGKAQGLAYF